MVLEAIMDRNKQSEEKDPSRNYKDDPASTQGITRKCIVSSGSS
jgi:hypothetical protein